jgi:hypothetical protein
VVLDLTVCAEAAKRKAEAAMELANEASARHERCQAAGEAGEAGQAEQQRSQLALEAADAAQAADKLLDSADALQAHATVAAAQVWPLEQAWQCPCL